MDVVELTSWQDETDELESIEILSCIMRGLPLEVTEKEAL